MAISPIRQQAFIEEFPFLKGILAEYRHIESISVKRMTKELLDRTPKYRHINGNSTYSFNGDEAVYLVTVLQKEPLDAWSTIMLPDASFDSYYTDNNHEARTNIGYAIVQSMTGQETHVVVVELDENNYGHDATGRSVTVYKPPKDQTVQDIVNQAQTAEREAVKAEANF